MKAMIKYLSHTSKKLLTGTALLRLDFNTEDDWRMQAVLPTIKSLLKTSSKVVIVSHRGRPTPVSAMLAKQPIKFDKNFSLKKDAATLSAFLGKKVTFINNFDFEKIKSLVARAPRRSIFLLENLRFMKGEEENDPKFAKQLSSLGDFYVNDAFAVSHRANASVEAITKFLPSYAGFELEDEIRSLSRAMTKPNHPLIVLLGGAKAADKLGIIKYFKSKTDWFLLGGGPANTILWLRGMDVKKSVKDSDPKDLVQLKKFAKDKSVLVPVDFKWYEDKIVDTGPQTIKNFAQKIAAARTIIWSGDFGVIERKEYAQGSLLVAKAIAKNRRAFSLAGGGETVMFLKKYGLDKKFSFISTGGGAMVDYLGGEKLPGIEALKK